MKRILFSLLALVGMTLTASAVEPAYSVTLAEGIEAHGTVDIVVGGVHNATSATYGQTVEVVFNLDAGWSVGTVTGQWSAAVAAARSIDMLKDFELTLKQGTTNTYTFVMERANVEISYDYRKQMSHPDITITVEDLTYTGSALLPSVTVMDGDTELKVGTDYTVDYANNKDAAPHDATSNPPVVVISAAEGSDKYAGTALETFTISPAELTAVTLVSDKLAYNEQEQAAQVQTVKAGDITVPADGFDVTDNKGTNVGNYTAKVTGKGNFTGTVDVAWSIVEGTSSVTFSQKTYEKTFGDEDFTVEPTVTGDGILVYSSSDEKVATVDSGTGLVHILGTGTVTITATMSGDNIVTSSDSYELTVSPKQTTVTIGATGMITYCGTEALDFTGNEDLEAYTVIGCSYGSNTIWMSRVYNVPAETPIVIKAAKEGTYELNIATSTDSYYLNRLVGNLSGSTIQVNETSEDGTVRNYYLKSGEFKKVSNYANIANGKAYLQMPASVADEKAGSAVDITLSSTGKSTLCSDVDLDFSGVEGLKAYVVTGYDMPTKTFWLNRVVEASAGTPLYLAGKANTTYSIPSKGVKTSFENMLVGNLSGSTIQVVEMSEDGALRNLYLKEGTFKKVNNYVNIYNGKCYLQAPSDIVAAMARGMEDPDFNLVLNDELMSIGFSDIDDEATGIVPIENGQWTMDNSAGAWYDLQGRKLQGRPTRSGVYVNNGRKVVLK